MKLRCALFLTTALLAAALDTSADPVIDQSLVSGNGGVSSAAMAQTFTVGIAGRLTGVSLPISGSLPVLVEIRRTDSRGFPGALSDTAAVLAQRTLIPGFDGSLGSPDFTPVDFSGSSLLVRPGDLLAITVRAVVAMNAPLPGWASAVDDAATYPGGEAFLDGPGSWIRFTDAFGGNFSRADLLFTSHVDPAPIPEPGSLILCTLGIAVGILRSRAGKGV